MRLQLHGFASVYVSRLPQELNGDTLYVSGQANCAVFYEADRPCNGTVYVYARANGNWSLQAELRAPNGAPGDSFGTAIASSGDTL